VFSLVVHVFSLVRGLCSLVYLHPYVFRFKPGNGNKLANSLVSFFLFFFFFSFSLRHLNPWLTTTTSELSRFIAAGRLHAFIEKVHGIVETTRPSLKNAQYETVVKQGDVLLDEHVGAENIADINLSYSLFRSE
jgi:hypothetical protein